MGGNEGIIAYLQRFDGYGLTGSVAEEVLRIYGAKAKMESPLTEKPKVFSLGAIQILVASMRSCKSVMLGLQRRNWRRLKA